MILHRPLVSIIVPTYNEEADIRRTLEALVKLRYPHKEVIVVDDASTDRTVGIVMEYVEDYSFLKLLRQPENRGVASARNAGIRACEGDIIVVLNADVFPRQDFLDRILPHYQNGADYVLVDSEVANQERVFPRYLEALYHFCFDGQDWIEWTEGFSCRKTAALDVGLFPEDIPGCGGEDAVFGIALSKQHKKVIDRSVVVPHIAPASLGEFWSQQKSRGRNAPFAQYYIYRRGLAFLLGKFAVKLLYCPVRELVVFPFFFAYYCRSRQAVNRRLNDLFPFLYATTVGLTAQRAGEWIGWLELYRRRR